MWYCLFQSEDGIGYSVRYCVSVYVVKRRRLCPRSSYIVFFFFIFFYFIFFFFQAEDGIRDLVRSRGLGDVYKRQVMDVFSPASKPLQLQIHNKTYHGLGVHGGIPVLLVQTLSLIHI